MREEWRFVPLDYVCEIGGPKPEPFAGEKDYYPTGVVDADGHVGDPDVVTYDERPIRANSLPQAGDVGFARMRGTKKVIRVTDALAGALFSTGFCFLDPGPQLDSKFLTYFVWSDVFQQTKDSLSGTGIMGSLKVADAKRIPIPLPPLDEQKRIVTILDEVFEGIDVTVADAEKNLANVRELFEIYTKAVFTRGEGWPKVELKEICGFQNGFAFKSKLFRERGTPVLRISNIHEGSISDHRPVFADPSDYPQDLTRYEVHDGDLLIAMSGATTGKIGFNRTGRTYLLNQRVGKFEPGNNLDIYFLYLYLHTRIEHHLRISAGSAQPNLSTKQIKSIAVPLPPIGDQRSVVRTCQNLLNQVNRQRDIYLKKIESLRELKQSILEKAFSGDLTAKEADKEMVAA